MRFGIFYEMQLPRPWEPKDERRLFEDTLEQIALADRLGFECVWAVEHHFLEEYSHCSAPEMLLSAASQRTEQIQLGHGVVQLCTNHPVRVAERAATLDHLSGGRVQLGVGEGSSPLEIAPFGQPLDQKREVFEEAVRAFVPMFAEERHEFHGRHFDIPVRNVIPKPAAKTSPPLWLACSRLETAAQAARWGMGALGFQLVSADVARQWAETYYGEAARPPQKLAEYIPNPNLGMVAGFMCAETDELAREQAAGWTFFAFALLHYLKHDYSVDGDVAATHGTLWERYLRWRDTDPAAEMVLDSGLVGSPETIRDRLLVYEDAHVDQVILLVQAGRTAHDDICTSMELFAREVMPEFHERHAEHEAWKRSFLAGELGTYGDAVGAVDGA